MRRRHRKRAMAVISATAVAAMTLTMASTAQAAESSTPPKKTGPAGPAKRKHPLAIPAGDRDSVLGKNWKTSGDRAVTTAADSDGLHLLVADAKTGYHWKTATVLSEPQLPADTWIGNSCLMDDHHAAVVYAPRTFTNKPDLMMGGALTAVVDLDSGDVTKMPFTASLAYFDPTCNAQTHSAAFTALREDKTRLITVDTHGDSVADVTARGEITSAVAVEDGLIGAAGNRLVHISRKGKQATLTATKHAPYDITAGNDGTVTYIDRTGDTQARVQTYAHGTKTTVAHGETTAMGLAQDTTGKVYLLGRATRDAAFGHSGITEKNVPHEAQLSTRGRLAVDPVVSDAVERGVANIKGVGKDLSHTAKEPATGQGAGSVSHLLDITATSTVTGQRTTLTADEPAATAGGTTSPALTGDSRPQMSTMSLMTTATDDPRAHDPVDSDAWCSVPRNDVNTQALQPTPNQVEWAVDMAVRGDLTSGYIRQGGWRTQTGLATIDPQGTWPAPTLNGGGRIPAQVELGVLAQESNLWQAESGAIPGQMGSPLASVDGYYGHQTGGSLADYWTIHWDLSDCGYGVGQVTDGMRKAGFEKDNETSLDPKLQRAVALDYTMNIAASLHILADKWNEVHEADQTITVNNDDPAKPENWFTAVWNYNLGFNPRSKEAENGNWGLGWFNNPANPVYPADRDPFMDMDADPANWPWDAAHPQYWPYEEKVMGWAAWSIDTGHSYATSGRQDWPGESGYSSAGFYPAWWNTTAERTAIKPPLDTFCNAANNCDAANPPDCPDADCYTQYWWNAANATWKDNCSSTCGNEKIKYATLISEPGRGYRLQYGTPQCDTGNLPSGAKIVASVPAGTLTWSDCGTTTTDGSFQFTFYPDPGATGPGLGQYDAKADLHQIGGGYQGHFWYAHTRDQAHLGGDGGRMTIQGDWKLPGPVPEEQAAVYVHIPDTGAQTTKAFYEIPTALGTAKVVVNQDANESNTWVYLGAFRFNDKAPEVRLSNTTYTGSGDDDIAWDAMAFIPGDYGIPRDYAVDLALPAYDSNSPNPNQAIQSPDDKATAGLGKDASNPGPDGSLATSVSSQGLATWCDDGKIIARSTRTIACENRAVPYYYITSEGASGTIMFQIQRVLELDGTNSFTEHLSIAPDSVPLDIADVMLAINKHLCDTGCTPDEPGNSAWNGAPNWTPGDTHAANLTTTYTWDNSVADKEFLFHPDVQIDGDIYPSDNSIAPTHTGYQWSKSTVRKTDLDEIRCDTKITATGGCVFHNYAPTYTFNAAKYPQAAAHAWLIQHGSPKSPGLKSMNTPLYYLPGGRNGANRAVICDVDGWARTNYDPAAMNSSTDAPNCDEFSFNASYNSGGQPADLDGLNPVSTGAECMQTYAQMDNGTVHLRNLPGTMPSFREACGRSSISGVQNSGSMAAFSSGFAKNMRLMDRDAYWLNTNIEGDCATGTGTFMHCTMTTN